ncbi:hypothetical protein KKA33_01235 [Patescibacteria group bacterium]|nr:hypothetical protein [Patescibacteria group bacterium]
MSSIKNPSFAASEYWPDHNDDPADAKRQKPLIAQVAKTEKGRAMQLYAEECELEASEGQDPESLLIAREEAAAQLTKEHREKPKEKTDGKKLTRKARTLLRFNQDILNQVADEAEKKLSEKDTNKAHRLIARLEGLKMPAIIDREMEKDYQDVIDANRGRKAQLEAINSVLAPLYEITEKANEENEQVKELAHQAIAELRNKRQALKAISDILSTPKEKRMPNWYQVVQGWNREVLQSGKYLLALFTRARATNPDVMLKAYPKIAHEAPELKQDYIEAVTAFTGSHNHFSFSETVMEEARRHKSPLARRIDGVMKQERPEEDEVESFHTTITRLPRKKIKEVLKMIA